MKLLIKILNINGNIKLLIIILNINSNMKLFIKLLNINGSMKLLIKILNINENIFTSPIISILNKLCHSNSIAQLKYIKHILPSSTVSTFPGTVLVKLTMFGQSKSFRFYYWTTPIMRLPQYNSSTLYNISMIYWAQIIIIIPYIINLIFSDILLIQYALKIFFKLLY